MYGKERHLLFFTVYTKISNSVVDCNGKIDNDPSEQLQKKYLKMTTGYK